MALIGADTVAWVVAPAGGRGRDRGGRASAVRARHVETLLYSLPDGPQRLRRMAASPTKPIPTSSNISAARRASRANCSGTSKPAVRLSNLDLD